MDMACEYIIQYIISSNTRLSLLTPCIFQCGCRYGDKEWSVCEPCQAIHEPQCDLSQETSDPRQWYYARVQARSSKGLSPWVTSTRLYPQWDSECQTYCVSPVLCGSWSESFFVFFWIVDMDKNCKTILPDNLSRNAWNEQKIMPTGPDYFNSLY